MYAFFFNLIEKIVINLFLECTGVNITTQHRFRRKFGKTKRHRVSRRWQNTKICAKLRFTVRFSKTLRFLQSRHLL